MAGSTTLDRFMADLGELLTQHFGGDEAPDEDEDLYEDEPEDEVEEDEPEDEAEDEPEDEADDTGEEDEEEEEDEQYSREELEEMNLRQLRSLAREADYSTAELKGYDKDALVSLLLGEEEGEADE